MLAADPHHWLRQRTRKGSNNLRVIHKSLPELTANIAIAAKMTRCARYPGCPKKHPAPLLWKEGKKVNRVGLFCVSSAEETCSGF